MNKLEALFVDLRKRLDHFERVEVDPRIMRDAIWATQWHILYTEGGEAVMNKVRAVARGMGMQFETRMALPGDDRVIFTLIRYPESEVDHAASQQTAG